MLAIRWLGRQFGKQSAEIGRLLPCLEPMEDRLLPSVSVSLLKDLNLAPASSNPGQSQGVLGTTVGSVTYFAASDGVHGDELWRTDDTATGTYMVKDINPTGSSAPDL